MKKNINFFFRIMQFLFNKNKTIYERKIYSEIYSQRDFVYSESLRSGRIDEYDITCSKVQRYIRIIV